MSSLLRGCLLHIRQSRMCSYTMCPNPAVLPTIRQCWEIIWHFTRNFLSYGIIMIKFQSPSFFSCHQNINPDTIRLCQTHADAICDSSGKIKPEPVRTKRREFFRAFFYIGIGKQWKLWLLLFISKVYGLNGYILSSGLTNLQFHTVLLVSEQLYYNITGMWHKGSSKVLMCLGLFLQTKRTFQLLTKLWLALFFTCPWSV